MKETVEISEEMKKEIMEIVNSKKHHKKRTVGYFIRRNLEYFVQEKLSTKKSDVDFADLKKSEILMEQYICNESLKEIERIEKILDGD